MKHFAPPVLELAAKQVILERWGKRLLQEVTVDVPQGAILGVVGPNGAGKTTLLRLLAGIIEPHLGEVSLGGRPLRGCKPNERVAQIAYLPQTTPVPFAFTPRELVRLSCTSTEAETRVLTELGLLKDADRSLSTLSGGERQRAALARVLAQESRYYLLDEPFTHLDPKYQLILLKILRQRAEQGHGVVLILHELALAYHFCDQILLLDAGRVVIQASPEIVFTDQYIGEAYGISLSADRGALGFMELR